MSLITTVTQMWLTRSRKPFTFQSEGDQTLLYTDAQGLGLYVHIPFCQSICTFCPYCKQPFQQDVADRYLDALIKEIRLVGSTCDRKKTVTSLYFGGGTPALIADRLHEIVSTVEQYFVITEGIGIELHPDNVTVPLLTKLKEAGVTKISIGIQSFQEKYQSILGRHTVDTNALYEALSSVSFETVSMDFIFALPSQTKNDLVQDIDTAFQIGANHIAIYPFIDFTFTKSDVKPMKNKEKRKLLDEITSYCLQKGLTRDSIWTFSEKKTAHYSSMTRDNFLGFGASATTLLRDQFKINTFSVEEYVKRIDETRLPTSLTLRFTERQRMIYYLFWTAYTTRVDSRDFESFFGKSLKKQYGFEIFIAKLLGYVKEQNGVYEMTAKGAFYYHYYENFYTLAYIDKMWGILRREAFPNKITL